MYFGSFRVPPHLGEITAPKPAAGQFEDLSRLDPAHKVLEGAHHGSRVGPFASQPQGLLEKVFVKRKTCTFHAYSVALATSPVKSHSPPART